MQFMGVYSAKSNHATCISLFFLVIIIIIIILSLRDMAQRFASLTPYPFTYLYSPFIFKASHSNIGILNSNTIQSYSLGALECSFCLNHTVQRLWDTLFVSWQSAPATLKAARVISSMASVIGVLAVTDSLHFQRGMPGGSVLELPLFNATAEELWNALCKMKIDLLLFPDISLQWGATFPIAFQVLLFHYIQRITCSCHYTIHTLHTDIDVAVDNGI